MNRVREHGGAAPLRLAIVHRSFDVVGGAERILADLGRSLVDAGHELHLHCARYRAEPDPRMIRHRLPDSRFGRIARYRRLIEGARRVAAMGYDAVIGFGRFPGQDLHFCQGGTHADYLELLVDRHGRRHRRTRYDRMILDVERRMFTTEAPLRVVAPSSLVRDEIHRVYGFPRERIEVVANGVDVARFHPSARDAWRERTRSELGIAPGRSLLCFVGIGWDRKGLAPILEAMAKRPALELVVVGRDREERRFRSEIERLGLAGRVHLVGPRPDVERYYAASDLFVLPSFQEAFGLVVVEALGCGTPVVTARCVGAAELLDGPLAEGVIEDPRDAGELGAAVDRMLTAAADPAIGARCRAVAEAHGLEPMNRRMEQLIREVAAEKAGGGGPPAL